MDKKELRERHERARQIAERWHNAELAKAWDEGRAAPQYRTNLNGDYLGETPNPYRAETK